MSNNLSLPATGYVRLPAVLHHIPVSKSTWWDGIRTGRYPKPRKLSERTVAWRAEDIHQLIAELSENESQKEKSKKIIFPTPHFRKGGGYAK